MKSVCYYNVRTSLPLTGRRKKKKAREEFHLTMTVMKQYKLLTLLNVGPWMYIIFYTLFDEMGSMQKVPLLHTEV